MPGARAAAQQQVERVREHRLARARLAGEHVETRGEAQLGPFDEEEVLDAQLQEHVRACTSGHRRTGRLRPLPAHFCAVACANVARLPQRDRLARRFGAHRAARAPTNRTAGTRATVGGRVARHRSALRRDDAGSCSSWPQVDRRPGGAKDRGEVGHSLRLDAAVGRAAPCGLRMTTVPRAPRTACHEDNLPNFWRRRR